MNEQRWLEKNLEAVICFDFGEDVLERVLNDFSDQTLTALVRKKHAERLTRRVNAQAWARAERMMLERVGRNVIGWDECDYRMTLVNLTEPRALEMVLDVPEAYFYERTNTSRVTWAISLGEILRQRALEPSDTFSLYTLRRELLNKL